MLQKTIEALQSLKENDVETYIKDLIINKTYSGLNYQEIISKDISQKNNVEYTIGKAEDEKKGIDVYIGEEPFSIKPNTYDNKILQESINHRMIKYKKTDKGIIYTLG
jgi:hypothetical protein